MKISDYWKPDDQDFIANPFPHYEAIRKDTSAFASPSGDYVLLSYEDLKAVLLDRNFESGLRKSWVDKICLNQDRIGIDFTQTQKATTAMLTQFNPPEHTTLRTFLAKKWPSTDLLRNAAKTYTEEVVDELQNSGDLVNMVSRKLPKKVMNHVLGLDLTSNQNVQDGVNILRVLDPYITIRDLELINSSAQRLYNETEKSLIDSKGQSFGHQIISFKETTAIDFDPISMILFLYISGLDTTSSLISSAILYLLKNKEVIERLHDDTLRINFIHEILRLQSPVQITGRISKVESEIGGLRIPTNSVVTLCIAAANRDPNVFENADQVDLSRNNHNHLGFGYGIHYCLGGQLAIIEADELIKQLLPILPNMELSGAPVWGGILSLRNIRHLNFLINEKK